MCWGGWSKSGLAVKRPVLKKITPSGEGWGWAEPFFLGRGSVGAGAGERSGPRRRWGLELVSSLRRERI